METQKRIYRENPKHKRGTCGHGPPRWFPSADSICPDDVSFSMAQALLDVSVEGKDSAHPDARARYALDSTGRFFKAYSEDGGRTWHGYPVRRDLVTRQIPARVLREFCRKGLLSEIDYRRLLGSAR